MTTGDPPPYHQTFTGNTAVIPNPSSINAIDTRAGISAVVKTDLGEAFRRMGINTAHGVNKCTVCSNFKEIVIHYNTFGLDRYICRECCQKAFDKLLGVNINTETEKVLYGTTK